MGYLHLAFGAGNTSGMNVSCNLNELLHMCFNVAPYIVYYRETSYRVVVVCVCVCVVGYS